MARREVIKESGIIQGNGKMPNQSQTLAVMVAFVALALTGGRLLVEASFGKSLQRRVMAAIGTIGCVVIFGVIVVLLR